MIAWGRSRCTNTDAARRTGVLMMLRAGGREVKRGSGGEVGDEAKDGDGGKGRTESIRASERSTLAACLALAHGLSGERPRGGTTWIERLQVCEPLAARSLPSFLPHHHQPHHSAPPSRTRILIATAQPHKYQKLHLRPLTAR